MSFMKIKNFNVLENVSLKDYCTFKIGGKAKYLFVAETATDLIEICKACKQENIKFKVIGMGANLLFSDAGYKGAIIVNKSNNITFKDNKIIVDSGVNLTNLILKAYVRGLSGIENLSGIPATIGGAIVNNVGAFGTEIGEHVEQVEAYDKNLLTKITLKHEDCQFAYRNSLFKKEDYIITSATLNLKKDTPSLIKKRIDEAINKKRTTQPLDYPSAGSVFKRSNIIPAKVIDDLNLKGLIVGKAQISKKHAGFIVNLGEATSQDVKGLISVINYKVNEVYGENLQPEIEIVD